MKQRYRLLLSAVAIAAVSLSLLATAAKIPDLYGERSLVCRVLPNRTVPMGAALRESCPLYAYDQIQMIRSGGVETYVRNLEDLDAAVARGEPELAIRVNRDGIARWIPVPTFQPSGAELLGRFAVAVALSLILLVLPLVILWKSDVAATTPLLLQFSSLAILLIWYLSGHHSGELFFAFSIASAILPASIGHLALTFPRAREVTRRVPNVVRVPYIATGVLWALGYSTFDRGPAVWGIVDRLHFGSTPVAAVFLVVGCILAVRESTSAIERARAKALLYGTLPPAAFLVLVAAGWGNDLPGGPSLLATIGVALLPLSIGYAIARYQLFDLSLDVRRSVAYGLYSAILAGTLTTGAILAGQSLETALPFSDPALLFGVTFVGFLLVEPFRARLWNALEGWISPWTRRLNRLEHDHAEKIAQLHPPEGCARIFASAILKGLEPDGVSVFLGSGDDIRLAHATGPRAAIAVPAPAVLARLAEFKKPIHLVRDDNLLDPMVADLLSAGVEVAAPLRSGDDILGCALINSRSSRVPYTSVHLDFLSTLAAQTAMAMQNARLTEGLLTSERFATVGRVSANLAHELGKPLGVMEILATRLPSRLHDTARVERDAKTIADLASEMRGVVRTLLDSAQRPREGAEPMIDVGEAVDRAVQIVSRVHGEPRISFRSPPELPEIHGSADKFVRALANILENAVLSQTPNEVVEVVCSVNDNQLRLDIRDYGEGMAPEFARRAFEPFVTSRSDQGGSGLGLVISRDIVEELGGKISLSSASGSGTRVRIVLPLSVMN